MTCYSLMCRMVLDISALLPMCLPHILSPQVFDCVSPVLLCWRSEYVPFLSTSTAGLGTKDYQIRSTSLGFIFQSMKTDKSGMSSAETISMSSIGPAILLSDSNCISSFSREIFLQELVEEEQKGPPYCLKAILFPPHFNAKGSN